MSLKRIISATFLQRTLNHSSQQYQQLRHHNLDYGDTYSKTNVVLMTKEDDSHTYVEAFSPLGFRLTSGFRILGPCAIFPKSVLHWNVPNSEKITPESLSLFSMLEPKLDILILGIGDKGSPFDKNIIKYLRSKKINVEILPTEQACSTFNFLNAERRVVAAALIPPKDVGSMDDDLICADMDDLMTFQNDEEGIPDKPEIRRTMESFNKKGVLATVHEQEKHRKLSSELKHSDSDERNETSDEKPK